METCVVHKYSKNSEDGVRDNGDEEGPPFEQSMETYPEYSVANMVNVEDHKRYLYVSRYQCSSKTKESSSKYADIGRKVDQRCALPGADEWSQLFLRHHHH
ncbi:hypothetical protein RR48_13176 [Papilio machaon]|uniref:Uncharacterized protein n=1 Tax=Papilio machaon TaxID=76193 RepID=A0A194QVP2_PAPMA|nr:hypothetical protein RR48_13176 [Papilio machaon]